MAKRDADAILLVSSDDDADKTDSLSSRRRSKPKVSILTCSEPRRRKKHRISVSASRRLHQKSSIDEFQFFGEDFKDVFTGVKISERVRNKNYGLISTNPLAWKSSLFTKRRLTK